MSTNVCGIDPALGSRLGDLARNLDRDPARSKRLLRQHLNDDRGAFLRSALDLLKSDIETRGAQHLIGLLVEGGLLLPALCDPALGREQTLALAQAACRVDPAADLALARALAERAAAADAEQHADEHARIMEILGVVSDGIRIFPYLARLARHPNARVRSKAVLMLGRVNHSAKWVRQRLEDSDPRIRANAAEALWGVKTEEARELLRSLVHDSNNRVAGNAILGLYRLGDISALAEIVALARHESPMFRATAAWVTGESGDPRFTELLAGLLRDGHPVVRKRAFWALGAIRASAQSQPGPQWRIGARLLDRGPGRRLLLGIAGENGAAAPPLLPTHFSLSEDGQPILQYRVIERQLPEGMPLVFVLPRSAAAARACLPWKRPSALWRVLYYSDEPARSIHGASRLYIDAWEDSEELRAVENKGAPRFQSHPEAIAADLDRIPPAESCDDLWRNIARGVSAEGGIAGKRLMIVVSERPVAAPAPEELLAAVTSQAAVHVISSAPDSPLEDFCRRVNGAFRIGDEDAAVQTYLTLSARYEVAYQPDEPSAQTVKIRVHGPGICAETRLALTASEERGISPEGRSPRAPGPTGS